jgi:hypothetical protein
MGVLMEQAVGRIVAACKEAEKKAQLRNECLNGEISYGHREA